MPASIRRHALSLFALAALLAACDDSTPLAEDAGPPDAGCDDPTHHHQSWQLPPRTRLDYLFVIDDGPGMCEEQANLTRNFGAFSTFVFEELGASADVRLAVVRAGLDPDQGVPGAFNTRPADPAPQPGCVDGQGNPDVPDTADCAALAADGPLDPIIALGRDRNVGRGCDAGDPEARARCAKEDLERQFRCRATVGVGRQTPDEGLEAMRLALSCTGPNAALFGDCCVDTPTGPRYNPSCDTSAVADPPRFLRPEATLTVVFVSADDDCASPASNPAASTRAICRYGTADADGDGVPDGFGDPALCGDTPAACYRAECGGLDPEACAARCVVGPTPTACAWGADRLTPVSDFYRFLTGLKARPLEQLVVATVVGRPAFTPAGHAIVWTSEPPLPGCEPGATDDGCCPEGRCRGPAAPSCVSEGGEAYAGHRYLELARLMGDAGIGCAPPDAALPPDAERAVVCDGAEAGAACVYTDDSEGAAGGRCLPVADAGQSACSACVTICDDDYAAPLEAIKERVAQVVVAYCLDVPPACRVGPDARPCATPEELDDPGNYAIEVRVTCTDPDECAAPVDVTLERADWTLRLNQAGCEGEALLQLNSPPPAAGRVDVCFTPEG